MPWRDRLRPASWRGIPFKVEELQGTHGRRTSVHEFVDGEKPFVDDLGRKGRPFTIRGFLIGPDFDLVLQDMVKAAETPGAGKLIHPLYGEVNVKLVEPGLDTSVVWDQGGRATLVFNFMESGELQFPTIRIDPVEDALARAEEAEADTKSVFEETVELIGEAEFVINAAIDEATEQVADMNEAIRAPALAVQRASASIHASLRALEAAKADLGTAPGAYADAMGAAMVTLAAAANSSGNLGPLGFFKTTFANRESSPPALDIIESEEDLSPDTASERSIVLNSLALEQLFTRLAFVAFARSAARYEFPFFDEAVEVSAILERELSRLAEEAILDDSGVEIHTSLTRLRGAVLSHIADKAANLPRLLPIRTMAIRTTFDLAQDRYGDGSRATEIEDLNDERIIHPLFVPPMDELVIAAK